jgi:2,4'-dihydroxyacetophenone dioxygenase
VTPSELAAIAPSARHVGVDEVPWVPNTAVPGAEFRLLQADVAIGLYVMHGRMPPGLAVGTHHHTGAVHMFTFSGGWAYREHEYVNRAGSYLFEPPGSVHTLYVPDEITEVTETLSIIYGDTEYLDADGAVIGVSNAATNLEHYLQACQAAGVPAPTAIIR